MRILFLDQSGKLGGAELSLVDVASPYAEDCLIGLFEDGPFRTMLEHRNIPVTVLTNKPLQIRKDSKLIEAIVAIPQLVTLVNQVVRVSRSFDIIYANTQKALVVGALASLISHRPLVFHLRDILSKTHFSQLNRQISTTFTNHFASLVITNSKATQAAFIKAGGSRELTQVIYNGFLPQCYQRDEVARLRLRQELGVDDRFVVGHFSRFSPWKGQHILLQALKHCPDNVVVILVGDALFGEEEYKQRLYQDVIDLDLSDRVKFLGFRSDIASLMAVCDLVAHTSTDPEPFGRVIVEAMLCGTPIVAAAAGGVLELIEPGKTGWLSPPGDVVKLAEIIQQCQNQPEQTISIAHQAHQSASQRFNLETTNQQIAQLLQQVISDRG